MADETARKVWKLRLRRLAACSHDAIADRPAQVSGEPSAATLKLSIMLAAAVLFLSGAGPDTVTIASAQSAVCDVAGMEISRVARYTLQQAQKILSSRLSRDCLERVGIVHVAIIGSAARGIDGQGTDVDLLVTLAQGMSLQQSDRARLTSFLQAMLGRNVRLIESGDLELELRAALLQDQIIIF